MCAWRNRWIHRRTCRPNRCDFVRSFSLFFEFIDFSVLMRVWSRIHATEKRKRQQFCARKQSDKAKKKSIAITRTSKWNRTIQLTSNLGHTNINDNIYLNRTNRTTESISNGRRKAHTRNAKRKEKWIFGWFCLPNGMRTNMDGSSNSHSTTSSIHLPKRIQKNDVTAPAFVLFCLSAEGKKLQNKTKIEIINLLLSCASTVHKIFPCNYK